MPAAQTTPSETPSRNRAADRVDADRVDAVIVGAGFGGLYMLHRMRGLGLSVRVFDVASDVGGTWYWNRYPGARCDVESMQYSYSFSEDLQQEWRWSERFAGQPEILDYARHVADRFDLRRDITFETRVTRAVYDAEACLWSVETDRGHRLVARYLVMATGCLSAAKLPEIPGIGSFAGRTFHTGAWPHDPVDFSGRRVAVIGTGSSAIQAIPVIAEQAGHVTVFQRTPNFSIPTRNRPMEPEYEAEWKSEYAERRRKARAMRTGILYDIDPRSAVDVPEEERQHHYEARWEVGGTAFMGAFHDLLTSKASNDTAAAFVRGKIGEMVKDPKIAAILQPRNHPIGTKRICVDSHYFETFNRPNVALVDLSDSPIEAITPKGVRVAGVEYEVDDIVFATGFDAMTGTLQKIDIRGTGGLTLAEKWAAGPRTYLGLTSAGFPNMFMITGPGSPSVLSNMIVSIEQHVDWITRCLEDMRARGVDAIEPTVAAEDAWVEHGNEVANRTLYPQANSWYMGANVPGKPRVFMPYVGGVGTYRQKCDEVAAAGYEGFRLDTARRAAPAAAE
ncbi:MAG: flavin-containing monooxygenase [Alphaproteobacteria bacterium]